MDLIVKDIYLKEVPIENLIPNLLNNNGGWQWMSTIALVVLYGAYSIVCTACV